MTSFEVVSDELRTHASHLDGLVDRLNTAVSAAGSVTMDNSAYGILCAFLPPIVNATTQQHATDTLNAAVSGMSDTADNVRTAATSYDEQDQAAATPFQVTMDDSGPVTGYEGGIGGYAGDPVASSSSPVTGYEGGIGGHRGDSPGTQDTDPVLRPMGPGLAVPSAGPESELPSTGPGLAVPSRYQEK